MRGPIGLFVPGPTNVPEQVRNAIDIPMEDHRAPGLPAFTLPLFEDLKKIFKTETGRTMLFPSSGTGGWEAAVTNTLVPGDKVLASRFGQFSHLWVDLCQRHGLDVEIVDVDWGAGVPLDTYEEILRKDKSHSIKAVLATQNETATGVQSDIPGVRKALDAAAHPALLFVDGVSSIGSVDFRMDEWGVDVAVSGSQKGFMLPAGLAIMCVSEKAQRIATTAGLPRCYFDFADMIKANKDGYFPYTPPMALIRGLRVSVDRLLEEGLENVFARHHYLAEGVRQAVKAWGLSLFTDPITVITCRNGTDLTAAFEAIERALENNHFIAGAFAYELGYHLERRIEALAPTINGPLFQVAAFATKTCLDPIDARRIIANRAPRLKQASTAASGLDFQLDRAAYRHKMSRIHDYIFSGDIYQANLTFPVTFPWHDDIWTLFGMLSPFQKVAFGSVVDLPALKIASLSPELFFRKDGKTLTCRPMKGTMRRGQTPEEDFSLKETLQSDQKNRAENLMIVDLIRNDLGRLARMGSVCVKDMFEVETYSTLHQMVSTVQAEIEDELSVFDIFARLFPCGSVTGAPKIRAMEIIAEMEDHARGIYT